MQIEKKKIDSFFTLSLVGVVSGYSTTTSVHPEGLRDKKGTTKVSVIDASNGSVASERIECVGEVG